MKLSKTDKKVTISLLLLIIVFSFLTYRHFNKRVERISHIAPVGLIRYKYNVVRRKYSDRFIWEKLRSHSPIYLKDNILTGDKSDAIIRLNSGVEIELNPNSLIEINLIENDVSLKLKKGVIRAKGNQESVLIETDSGLVADIQGSDVTINQTEGGKADLFVRRGSVAIEDETGRTGNLEKDKFLSSGKNGDWEFQKIDIINMNPKEGDLLLTRLQHREIEFSWTVVPGNKKYELHLSRNSTFKPRRVISLNKNYYKTKLGNGNWYWRVFGSKEGKKLLSAKQSFNIQLYRPLKTLSPVDNMVVVTNPSKSLIFRWEMPKGNPSVRFSLARERSFKKENIIESKVLSAPSYIVKNLEKGQYYWKVEPEFGKRNVVRPDKKNSSDKIYAEDQKETKTSEFEAKKHTFVIGNTQQTVLKIPTKLYPSSKTILSFFAGVDKKVKFKWQAVEGADLYQFKLFLGDDKKLHVNKKTSKNQFTYPIPWETKVVEWELRAIQINRQQGSEKKTKPVRIRLQTAVLLPKPPKIISVTAKKLN